MNDDVKTEKYWFQKNISKLLLVISNYFIHLFIRVFVHNTTGLPHEVVLEDIAAIGGDPVISKGRTMSHIYRFLCFK
jgi:hypothetical protein